MVVHTNTEAVRASRKLTLQLLLSDHSVDCHHCLRIGSTRCADLDPKFCEWCFFCDCERDGFCDLQSLAREYEVDVLPFEQKHNQYPVDDSSVIVRNPNKCIKCKRCVDVCANVQTVHNLAASGRGSAVKIAPAFEKPMADSRCIGCARCVEVCPTGAIFVKERKDEMLDVTHTYGVKSVALADAALIPELERIWPRRQAPVTLEQIVGALKKLGFKAVLNADDMRALAAAETEKREALAGETGRMFESAFAFLEEAVGPSQELVLFVTEITAGFDTSWFVGEFGCDAYFRHNRELLFDETRRSILDRLTKA
jgi:NADH dehydrogenase/NADH:ubiquinone oxidoreductase subunit G